MAGRVAIDKVGHVDDGRKGMHIVEVGAEQRVLHHARRQAEAASLLQILPVLRGQWRAVVHGQEGMSGRFEAIVAADVDGQG